MASTSPQPSARTPDDFSTTDSPGQQLPPGDRGEVKTTTLQACRILQSARAAETPENHCKFSSHKLFTRVFLELLFNPSVQTLHHRLKYNLWVHLARQVNVSTFCLQSTMDMHSLLSTCLIPVCTPLTLITNHTPLSDMVLGRNLNYAMKNNLGPQIKMLKEDAICLYTPHVASSANST